MAKNDSNKGKQPAPKAEDMVRDDDVTNRVLPADTTVEKPAAPAEPTGTQVSEVDPNEVLVEKAKDDEAAWDVETWLSVAKRRIGVESHTLWAALREVDKDKTYTERQIRVLVERYLNKPIKRPLG